MSFLSPSTRPQRKLALAQAAPRTSHRRGEEYSAYQDGGGHLRRAAWRWKDALRCAEQPGVSGRGNGCDGPGRPGPCFDWRPAGRAWAEGDAGAGGCVRALGAARAHSADQRVVVGAVQAGGQLVPCAARVVYQCNLCGVRGVWGGRGRSGARRGNGLAHRAQVFEGVCWVWRVVLPEGHFEPGVPVRVVWARRGGALLPPGGAHERLPEGAVCAAHHPRAVQHGDGQEDCAARVCVQEGHGRHARVGVDRRVPAPDRGEGAGGDLRPQGGRGAGVDGPDVRVQDGQDGGAEVRDAEHGRAVGVPGRARDGGGDGVGRVQGPGLHAGVRHHGQAVVRVRRAQHSGPRRAARHRLCGVRHWKAAGRQAQHGVRGARLGLSFCNK
ncbi:UDP-glucose dehydrogenase [Gracilaria domingensis]|nr:UDP-glucose dehydrogenase [Gracilaria domingensis]